MSANEHSRTRWLVPAIVLLCLAGAWISGELVRQHAGATGGLLARICHAVDGTGAGCAGTLKSPFSELRIPVPRPTRDLTIAVRDVVVPVAFLGLAYFVFIGSWYVVAGHGRPWHRLPLHVAYCGLALSFLYMGLMAFGAAPWCVGCLAVHTINFLLVATVWRLSARTPSQNAVSVTTRQALAAVAVTLALVGGLWMYRRENLIHREDRNRLLPYQEMVLSLQRDPEFLMREYVAQPHHEIPLRETEIAPAGRPRLVVFTDFECPACFCHATTVQERLVELFDERLTVLVRHYPLCHDCNDGVEGTHHANACRAAFAAEAARRLGGETAFRQMHDLLFENGRRLGDETYRELAPQIGLDPDLLMAEIDSDEVRRIVADDVALADELGVSGTPAMFLDGRQVTELCQSAVFWRAYADRCGTLRLATGTPAPTQTELAKD
ncbi:MAG: DsbA family protein [Planctomycetota bacterium]|jgi:predicted DsbA family dithiol-disulfide isomerase